jgi:hypothetical protein
MTSFDGLSEVPQPLQAKIKEMISGDASGSCVFYDDSRRRFCMWSNKLADHNNMAFLSDAQARALFFVSYNFNVQICELIDQLVFEFSEVELRDSEVRLTVPTGIAGFWPHIALYGLMDEDGRIHT